MEPAPSTTARPSPVRPGPETRAAPRPGDPELAAARKAMEAGHFSEAAERFEQVISLGEIAPGRGAALYTLALLLARPDNPGRDAARARILLEDLLASGEPVVREAGARLILSLLEIEGAYRQQIEDLRIRMATMGAESDDLRGLLAQREMELRRIKEILLGRATGS